MLSSKPNEEKIVNFSDIICFILVYMSGSVLFIALYYKEATVFLFVASLVYFMYKKRMRVNKNALITLLILYIILITFMPRENIKLITYIGIALQLSTAFLLGHMYDYQRFISSFIKVMYLLAAVSLVLFSLSQIYPEIASYFPHFDAITHTSYNNAIFYEFKTSIMTSKIENRNSSIFWEPGAYAFFLNLALFFIFDKISEVNFTIEKKTIGKIIIITMAIISTFSTTGVIVLVWLYVMFLIKTKSRKHKAVLIIAAIASTLILFVYFGYGDSFVTKTAGLLNDITKISNRLSLNDLVEAFDLFGIGVFIGISFETYQSLLGGTANSIIYYMVSLGLPFFVIMSMMYYHMVRSISKKNAIFLAILLICFFLSESFMIKPMLLYLCFAMRIQKTEPAVHGTKKSVNS